MQADPRITWFLPLLLWLATPAHAGADEFATPLPTGVKAVWDMSLAAVEHTNSRERICVNGLWRWQPSRDRSEQPPRQAWGYFKVPGCWPGITDYMQKDSQTVFAHPRWKDERLERVTSAWYEREITIPETWAGRRITLRVQYVNSLARVYLDGKNVGNITFPAGEIDLTGRCRPGHTHVLSMLVTALPLHAVMLAHNDTNTTRPVPGSVARRGLCGDVFLWSTPAGARIADIRVATSVRNGTITINTALEQLAADAEYSLHAAVSSGGRIVHEFTSRRFRAADLNAGRLTLTEQWKPDRLWDIHTPQNVYAVTVSLRDSSDKALDVSFAEPFGFREFWIDGRDFYLNGSRIFLCAVPLDNAQVSTALANYQGAKESLERLKAIGINFVYTHNYGCEPGSHLSFSEILRAADDVGMLVAFSQPHFDQYDWKDADAEKTNGYARHAAFYVHEAQNHPSVVAYAMSHNATGYEEDMNPDLIDGIHDPRSPGGRNYAQRALRAEAIVQQLDPSRIVYHHSSGNLGSMHTMNFYPNFCPIQELSDWFEHWSTHGVKPVFTCEYGAPFSWDWAMFRGWYHGERSFGSARVPWELCLSEWNAQFVGDLAYQTSEPEQADLRWEAKQLRAGRVWYRWDYPYDLNSKQFAERYPIIAKYLADNWRAFRTWQVSAISPWEHGQYWKLRDGVDRGRKVLAVDWTKLQRPGLSPDYVDQRYERIDLAYEREDWVPTAAADALLRNNQPLLAYIAGKPAAFTSKDHSFLPGESFQKQLIVINNSRETVKCECRWSVDLPTAMGASQTVSVPTGDQVRLPLEVQLRNTTLPGRYQLRARFNFEDGSVQEDAFTFDVLPQPVPPNSGPKIALFDPRGESAALLRRLEVPFQTIDANTPLTGDDLLIIGQAALTLDGPAPDIARVRDGLRVIMFEQTADVLEKRLGLRVAEYGLRQVFRRTPSHPILAGLGEEQLRDWRGAATILPPRLQYELRPRYGPTVRWCDIPVTRLWRCGNRGNVASILIEKPARGDFLPIVDGGFSLQYSPLLEYREGSGVILFCQMDVTGRTEDDPAADTLTRNLLNYTAIWKALPRRTVVYAGDPAGRGQLESAGISVAPYEAAKLTSHALLVIGPGGGKELAGDASRIAEWLQAGGRLLAIGLNQADVDCLSPLGIRTRNTEYIAGFFEVSSVPMLLAGVGPADVHNRDPRQMPLVSGGATAVGGGILAQSDAMNCVLCQLVPWRDAGSEQPNLRRNYRRSSFLVNRLLANLGAAGSTHILEDLARPVKAAEKEQRWLDGLYLDRPDEWDDPYRFFRW